MELDLHELKVEAEIQVLENLQCWLEMDIANYEITFAENINDEEQKCIARHFIFSRGDKEHNIVIHPDGFIRYYDKMPLDLMADIHNAIAVFISYQDCFT
ncbi:MAG: hypothetical protein ED554_11000 [Synechococcus sp. YX04-3]|nr:MAG: hypothetical protein ED554_11000 [Synechococcus sp. YX04-3]